MDLGLNPSSSAFVILGDDSGERSPPSEGVRKAGWQRGKPSLWELWGCDGPLEFVSKEAFVLQTLDLSCPWGGAQ